MGASSYLQAGTALLGGAGGYSAAKGQRSALNSQAWASDQDARIADWQSSQAIVSGQASEEQARLEGAQVVGRERAALGANGVDLGSGSANDVLTSAKVLGEDNALQIHDNALRQAWGYQQQAINDRNQAALDRSGASAINPSMAAFTSLLGSAKQSGFSYGSMKMPGQWQTGMTNFMSSFKGTDYDTGGGGLSTGAGGSAGVFSDARLKTNIRRIGTTARGNAWYTWDWKTGGSGEGVIAQEVAHIPGAVHADADGILMVDYSKV